MRSRSRLLTTMAVFLAASALANAETRRGARLPAAPLRAPAPASPSSSAPTGSRLCCEGPSSVLLEDIGTENVRERLEVIRDEVAYCDLWDEIHMDSPVPCDTSNIDFATEVAVVVAIGFRPDLCFDVDIDLVCQSVTDGHAEILYREIVPNPTCACPRAVSSPYEVIKLQRPVVTASFRGSVELSCRF